ncbi:ribbon-helix-helix protein, CopG family [Desulfotomaculum copahuensis]|uniref:Ribbon-helix-helix protein CopG domain-containing protein n=1 Tax=Desulfotomaculum copahuensis TaxID=1838280 RepID=A0A1B7LBI4_9FIRM|nr:ribbon-helix-helix protein, CopG family [Desulfotomaculum copahuensis]OAT79905.1 hypothetical protein A6M21_14430 [Desulfotomaculum copahuensis]
MANVIGGARAYVAFQVRVYPELKERLMQRSMETGLSQREIVADALKSYLQKADESGAGTKASVTRK